MIAYGPRRLIKIKEGLAHIEWLRENVAGGSYNAQPFGADSTKYETQGAFGKRVGAKSGTIRNLAKLGLPKAKNGWICIEDGLEWLKRQGSLTKDGQYIRQRAPSTPGSDSRSSFANRIGVGRVTLHNLIKKGLPINERHLISVAPAMQWLRREGCLTTDGKYIKQSQRQMPEFDSRRNFAKKIDVSKTTIASLIKEGLPVSDCGLIPIEPAMQWLKRQGLLTEGGEYTRKQHAIPDRQIKQAMVMRRRGYTWKTIGEHLGVRHSSIFNAVQSKARRPRR
jgi:hypothetical protein